jgi:hypothetical protein
MAFEVQNKFTTKIAGIFKYPEAKEVNKKTIAGTPLKFDREPTNPYDANAIALSLPNVDDSGLMLGWVRCGYIPKVEAAKLVGVEIESVVKGAAWDEIIITTKEQIP